MATEFRIYVKDIVETTDVRLLASVESGLKHYIAKHYIGKCINNSEGYGFAIDYSLNPADISKYYECRKVFTEAKYLISFAFTLILVRLANTSVIFNLELKKAIQNNMYLMSGVMPYRNHRIPVTVVVKRDNEPENKPIHVISSGASYPNMNSFITLSGDELRGQLPDPIYTVDTISKPVFDAFLASIEYIHGILTNKEKHVEAVNEFITTIFGSQKFNETAHINAMTPAQVKELETKLASKPGAHYAVTVFRLQGLQLTAIQGKPKKEVSINVMFAHFNQLINALQVFLDQTSQK